MHFLLFMCKWQSSGEFDLVAIVWRIHFSIMYRLVAGCANILFEKVLNGDL